MRWIIVGKEDPAADWPALVRLLGASTYLSDVLIREGKNWADVFLRQIKVKRKSAADHMKELAAEIHDTMSLDEFCAALRRHKQREYPRIGARDLMPSVTMEETVRELTALAEASLESAYRFCRADVEKEYGLLNLPGTEKPNRFVVLGMGKRAGRRKLDRLIKASPSPALARTHLTSLV
jgi:[glutamine synthetase] adenylyltransferase / [glutamine synthetase]-adenylyl-L-tyrosine phosphorylase